MVRNDGARERPHVAGCMRCGAELVYLDAPQTVACTYCGREQRTDARCAEGHFVCDDCHTQDGKQAAETLLLSAQEERDLIALFVRAKNHPSLPLHGPQYHAILPGVILTALRNSGVRDVDEARIRGAMTRGGKIPGGLCGFGGACGAALGAGIALGAFIRSTPLKPVERQRLHQVVSGFVGLVGAQPAARCCQRESYLVLKEVARRSFELFGVKLKAEAPFTCGQYERNAECLGKACPLYPKAA